VFFVQEEVVVVLVETSFESDSKSLEVLEVRQLIGGTELEVKSATIPGMKRTWVFTLGRIAPRDVEMYRS